MFFLSRFGEEVPGQETSNRQVPELSPEQFTSRPMPYFEPREVVWKSIASGQPAMDPPEKSGLQPVPPYPEAVSLGDGRLSHEQEIQVLHRLFDLYIEALGALPAGENNAQIMNALRGNNVRDLGLFPFEHSRLNKEGQLLDGWGSPYFFHLVSQTRIEIRSAGPDKLLFTEDDL